MRKGIGLATVTLDVKQYTGPPSPPADASGPPVVHIDVKQTATGNIKATTELRCLDDTPRDHSDWLFGTIRGRSRWATVDDVDDPWLAKDWLEGDEEKSGPNGETHLLNIAESVDKGWTATQVWGFQMVDGVRRYCRHVVVAKGSKREELKLVYDYLE